MLRKIVSKITLMLMLVVILSLAFNNELANAEQLTSQETRSEAITVFSDDFESYSVGSFPSPTWKLWHSGAGSSYQVITTSTYVSPTKSLQLMAGASLAAIAVKPLDPTYNRSSIIGYELNVKITKVGGADANSVLLGFIRKASPSYYHLWGVVAFWDYNGTIRTHAKDGATFNLQTYLPNTWYKIKVLLDRITNTYHIWINDALKGTFEEGDDTYDAEGFALWSCWQAPAKCFFDDAKLFALPKQLLTLFINPSSVQRGARVTFSGTLFPQMITTIYLFYLVKGTTAWVLAATLTTNSAGQYSWTVTVPFTAPLTTVYFMTYWPGNATYSPVLSNYGFPTPLTITT